MYKIVKTEFSDGTSTVIKKINSDESITFIPMVDVNADYVEYLRWVEEGNEPETIVLTSQG